MAAKPESVQMPTSIVSPVELKRVIREAEMLDETLHQASLRKGGEATSLPKVSRLLDDVLEANKLNVLHEADRKNLRLMLDYLQTKAPTIHMSFSADPSPLFMKKLVTWMRSDMHPYVLIRVGLQPSMGAGCVVRTSNKYFDFSLREHFVQKRQVLIDKLHQTVEAGNEQHA